MSDFFDFNSPRHATPRECHQPTAPDHPLTWVPDAVEFMTIFGPRRVQDSLSKFHEQKVEMRKERLAKETQDFEKCQASLSKFQIHHGYPEHDNYYYSNPYRQDHPNRYQQNHQSRERHDLNV